MYAAISVNFLLDSWSNRLKVFLRDVVAAEAVFFVFFLHSANIRSCDPKIHIFRFRAAKVTEAPAWRRIGVWRFIPKEKISL